MWIARLVVRSTSEAWRANRPFFVTVIAYVLLALIAAAHRKIVINLKIYNTNFLFFGTTVTLILLAVVLIRLTIQRPEQPLRAMKDLILANNLPDRIAVTPKG